MISFILVLKHQIITSSFRFPWPGDWCGECSSIVHITWTYHTTWEHLPWRYVCVQINNLFLTKLKLIRCSFFFLNISPLAKNSKESVPITASRKARKKDHTTDPPRSSPSSGIPSPPQNHGLGICLCPWIPRVHWIIWSNCWKSALVVVEKVGKY